MPKTSGASGRLFRNIREPRNEPEKNPVPTRLKVSQRAFFVTAADLKIIERGKYGKRG